MQYIPSCTDVSSVNLRVYSCTVLYSPDHLIHGSFKACVSILQNCLKQSIEASSISLPKKIRRDGQIHLKSGLGEFNDYRWESCYHQVLWGVCASIYTSLCRRCGLLSHTLAMIHLHTEPTHSPYQLWSIWHHAALYLMLTLMLRKDIPGIQNSSVKALLLFSFSPFLACCHHIIVCHTTLLY